MKYWVQGQAAAGNWYDSVGCNDLDSALTHARLMARSDKMNTRVVFRDDRTMAAYTPEGEVRHVPPVRS